MKLGLAFIAAVMAAPHCAPTLSGSPAVAHAMGHVDVVEPVVDLKVI